MRVIAGIDPGITGGLAAFTEAGLLAIDLPTIDNEIDGLEVADLMTQWAVAAVVLEESQAFPGQGVATTFRYGQAFGTIIGAVQARGIPISRVRPAQWKREVGLQPPRSSAEKGLTKAKATRLRKEQSIQVATELFPDAAHQWQRKKDNHRAEAALLAHWGRRRGL